MIPQRDLRRPATNRTNADGNGMSLSGAHQLGEGEYEGREGGDVGLQGKRGSRHNVALQQDAADSCSHMNMH